MPKGHFKGHWLRRRRPRALARLGQEQRSRGRLIEARKALKTAVAAPNPEPPWYAALAEVEADLGDASSSAKHFEQALRLDDQPGAWWLRLAEVYQLLGRTEDALRALGRAADDEQTRRIASRELGLMASSLDRRALALPTLQKVLELGADDHEVLAALAEGFLETSQTAAAVEALETCLATQGNHSRCQSALVRVLDEESEWERVVGLVRPWAHDAGVTADMLYRLGHAEERLGNLEAAAEAYERSLAKNSRRAWVHFRLGRVNDKQAKWHAAAPSYQAAVDLDAHRPRWHALLGHAYLRSGDYERAAHAYEDATIREPSNPHWHHELGRARARLKRWDLAAESFKRACSLGEENPEWYHELGLSLQRGRRWQEATDAYRRATELRPDNESWKERLSAAQERAELWSPPAFRRPTYMQGVLDHLKSLSLHGEVHLVGVGSGYVAGSEHDPLIELLLAIAPLNAERRVRALLIEPEPERASKLRQMFAGRKEVTVREAAVGMTAGQLELFRITEEGRTLALASGDGNDGRRYTSSDYDLVCRRLLEEFDFHEGRVARFVEPFSVPMQSLTEILKQSDFPMRIDVLQIDVQGLDGKVIAGLDFDIFNPDVIQYEIAHLDEPSRRTLRELLVQNGYEYRRVSTLDEVAVRVAEG